MSALRLGAREVVVLMLSPTLHHAFGVTVSSRDRYADVTPAADVTSDGAVVLRPLRAS